MASQPMSIDLREAAVAAAVVGAVVVILGYASGLGLHTPLTAVTVRPAPAVTTPAAPVPVPASVAVVPPQIIMVPVASAAPVPVHTYPHPTPPVPAPTVSSPAPASCTPGVLDGLLAPVDSLLGAVLGVLPSVAPTSSAADGLLGCTVGQLLGSTCCNTTAVASGKKVSR